MAGRTLNTLWFALTGVGLAAVLLERAPVDMPAWVPAAGAVVITVTYAFGLAARTGGRARLNGALALLLAVGALLSGRPNMVAGAAVGTAVLAGVLAVMATRPAARFLGVVRECLIATSVAVVGAFAVAAYDAQVSLERVGFLALGLSLLGAIGLVYRLGAGVHGLGTRGSIMLGAGVLLLLVGVAYTEALARWGPPGLVLWTGDTMATLRATLGGVPRPLQVFVGFPALAWGVSTRARTQQGWWVCAFGAPALAVVAVSLLDPEPSLTEVGLSLVYSAALGLTLGYLVIRADQHFVGARGRRARRVEAAAALRPEPRRMQPLL